jgi:hypothetical protein
MTKIADLALRVVLFLLAYYDFLGYMWSGWESEGFAYELYVASPWVALAIGAAMPNAMLTRVSGNLMFLPVALLAVVRSVDQLYADVTLINGPNVVAAVFRLLVIVLLGLVVLKAYLLVRKSSGLNAQK